MRLLVLVSLLLAVGVAEIARAEATVTPDECEGRNPLHCGKTTGPSEGSGEQPTLHPPGACEGRNPRYCKEQPGPKPKVEEATPRRGRASADRNPSRNPNRNPNTNPNRRPRRNTGGD